MSRVQKHKSKKTGPVILAVILILAIFAALWFLVINRKCTVDFHTSGGTAVESVRVKKGETVARPADPVKEGYVFKEWVCSGHSFDFNTPITEDTIIFALYKESVPANSIFFVEEKFYVAVGKTALAGIVLDPLNASEPVTYTSSNPAVVEIDAYGYMKGISAGTAEITARIEGLTAVAEVEVSSEITALEFGQDTYTLAAGETLATEILIHPADAEDTALSYISTNTNIVTVDETGVIEGIRPGEAVIIAAAKNGVDAQAKVVVGKAVESISLSPAEAVLELADGKTYSFAVKTSPEDALSGSYRWSSSNVNIAEVDRSGVITPKNPGTVTITCVSSNGKIARARLTVARRADSITAEHAEITLSKGETADLAALLKFSPESVKPQYTAVWTVKSGSSAVSVSSKGVVTGLEAAENPAVVEAVLTGLLGDSITVSFRVSVRDIPAESIELDGFDPAEEARLTLTAGESYKIKAKVLPENASDKKLSYALDTSGMQSSYADLGSCVKISSDGTITAVHGFAGHCTVVISAGSGIRRTLTVFVNEEVLCFEAEGKTNPGSLNFRVGSAGIPVSFRHISYKDGAESSSVPPLSEISVCGAKSGELSEYFVLSGGSLCLKEGIAPDSSLQTEIRFCWGKLKSSAVSCTIQPAEE